MWFKIDRFLDQLLRFSLFAILLSVTFIALAGVTSRYVFNSSLIWTEELAAWMFVWLVFLGAAYGHRDGRHIRIDIVSGMMPERMRNFLEFLSAIVVAYVTIQLGKNSAEIIELVNSRNVTLDVPDAFKFAPIPVLSGIAIYNYLIGAKGVSRLIRILRAAGAVVATGIIFYAETSSAILFEGGSPALIMISLLGACLIIGAPVAYAILFSVLIGVWGTDFLPIVAVLQNMVAGASKFILLAVPFFVAAGYLMNCGGITERLMAFADSVVGHRRGGLAHVNVLHSALMGGISGSSAADVANSTMTIVPQMVKRGYSAAFSCAVTTASAILPNIIPPSVAFLVYASVAEVSVSQLFIGGIGPGILLAALMMVTIRMMAVRRGFEPSHQRAPISRILRTFLDALPGLSLVLIILFGLRMGIVTVTEAASVAVVWAFLLGKVIYRAFSWQIFYDNFTNAALDSALVGFLIAVSVPFAWVLTAEEIPQMLTQNVLSIVSDPVFLLLLINLLLFVIGFIFELSSAVLIIVPILMPLIKVADIDPIHFGIVVIVNLMIGTLTPPFGILVFISSSISRVPAGEIFKEVLPFVLACLIGLALITYVPAISIGLWPLLGMN